VVAPIKGVSRDAPEKEILRSERFDDGIALRQTKCEVDQL